MTTERNARASCQLSSYRPFYQPFDHGWSKSRPAILTSHLTAIFTIFGHVSPLTVGAEGAGEGSMPPAAQIVPSRERGREMDGKRRGRGGRCRRHSAAPGWPRDDSDRPSVSDSDLPSESDSDRPFDSELSRGQPAQRRTATSRLRRAARLGLQRGGRLGQFGRYV